MHYIQDRCCGSEGGRTLREGGGKESRREGGREGGRIKREGGREYNAISLNKPWQTNLRSKDTIAIPVYTKMSCELGHINAKHLCFVFAKH